MKRAWHPEELVEHWTIVPGEWPLIEPKRGATRLGFAVLWKFFRYAGSFPRVRIPRQSCHQFQANPATDSTRKLPPIPHESCH